MSLPTYEYENTRRVCYPEPEGGHWSFVPVCQKCGRYVKADNPWQPVMIASRNPWYGPRPDLNAPNAICAKCGRVPMLAEGCI